MCTAKSDSWYNKMDGYGFTLGSNLWAGTEPAASLSGIHILEEKMQSKILIIEDDSDIRKMVANHIKKEGFILSEAPDGISGLQKFQDESFDLVLLDIMLPKMDGLEVMRHIREKSTTPILILSAKDCDVDKAVGLGMGADDYLAKPFSLLELSARVKALIRRAKTFSADIEDKSEKLLRYHDLTMNEYDFTLKKRGQDIKLTAKEFEILKLFITNPKRVFTKAQIYSLVWNDGYLGDDNVINVHMRRLREKIEDDPSNPQYIKTLWGIGYKLGDF